MLIYFGNVLVGIALLCWLFVRFCSSKFLCVLRIVTSRKTSDTKRFSEV